MQSVRRSRMSPRRRLAFQLVAVVICGLCAVVHSQQSRWVSTIEAGRFSCVADFDLDGEREVLIDLLNLAPQLAETLGIELSDEPIEVLLFRDKYSYQAYVAPRIPEGIKRPALYVKGDASGRVYAYRGRDFDVNVRHEGTHALLHAALPFVPLWLDEGLAEYFEVREADRAHGNPHLRAIRWNLRFGFKPNLGHLESRESMAQMKGREYRDSFALVHFMLHGPPAASQVLREYLQNAQAGIPPGSIGDHLRREFPDLEGELARHFRTWGE